MLTNVNHKPAASPSATGKEAVRQQMAAVPARFRGDPAVWAAWLYFRENMTQAEIGKVIGVSRATVNAYISDARERGIVSVRIDPTWLQLVELAQALTERFALADCMVIPALPEEATNLSLVERIGRAGADFLASQITPGATVAVAWGRTVLALAKAMQDPVVPDITVAQLTGGMTSSFDFSPELCASMLAGQLNARCLQLTAPALVSSSKVRSVLLAEPMIQEQLLAVRGADLCVFGICTTKPDSLIFAAGMMTHADVPQGKTGPAVAVVAGRCIAPDGSPIRDAYDDRVVGLPLDALAAIPTRIAVAGGLDKCEAIQAAMRGGYLTHLVTDEHTAMALLEA